MSEKKISSQGLTQGAQMAAVSAILSLLGYFLPFGMILIILAAVPISVLCTKQKMSTAFLSSVVALLLLSIFNIRIGLNYGLLCLPLGLVAGFLIKKRKKASMVLTVSTLVISVSIVLILLVGVLLTGVGTDQLLQSLTTFADEIKTESITMAEEMGLFETYQQQGINKAQAIAMINSMYDMIFMLAPACVILTAIVMAVLNFWACGAILKRMNYKVRRLPRFERWALPQWHIFIIIALWILALLGGDFLPLPVMTIIKNLLIIYVCVLIVVGIAVLAHKFNIRKQSSFMRMMLVFCVLFAISSGIILFAALIGLFDMIIDIRKLAKEKEEARARYEEKKALQQTQEKQESFAQDEDAVKEEQKEEQMKDDRDYFGE